MGELEEAIPSLKEGKTLGGDGITTEHVKYSPEILLLLLNKILLETEEIPPSMQKTIIILLKETTEFT